MKQPPKILILGVGNLLLCDEGVGVHIIRELEKKYLFPNNVELFDGGTLGLYLLPKIEEGFDYILIIDAIATNNPPGSIYVLDFKDLPQKLSNKLSPHETSLLEVLTLAQLNGYTFQAKIIGIVPENMHSWGMILSKTINDKLPVLIETLFNELHLLNISPSQLKVSIS
ncbi:HyaD/HybD family hydrogenase maturation endopeptidase [Candidatus Nomurabacteria bacterium]|nr:HyaD/HybD family hydrogenase maturation endopeptidase [Candidatus Nomurabacteria bacterium]